MIPQRDILVSNLGSGTPYELSSQEFDGCEKECLGEYLEGMIWYYSQFRNFKELSPVYSEMIGIPY